jgi:transposase-like protein
MIIDGARFYSIPEAAREVGVTRNTMFRWVMKEVEQKKRGHIRRDLRSGHYLVPEEFVMKNRVSNRYAFV